MRVAIITTTAAEVQLPTLPMLRLYYNHRVRAVRTIALVLAVLGAASPTWAGDGTQTWKTLETDHFVVHYYEPLGDVAKRVAVAHGPRSSLGTSAD